MCSYYRTLHANPSKGWGVAVQRLVGWLHNSAAVQMHKKRSPGMRTERISFLTPSWQTWYKLEHLEMLIYYVSYKYQYYTNKIIYQCRQWNNIDKHSPFVLIWIIWTGHVPFCPKQNHQRMENTPSSWKSYILSVKYLPTSISSNSLWSIRIYEAGKGLLFVHLELTSKPTTPHPCESRICSLANIALLLIILWLFQDQRYVPIPMCWS